MAKEMTGPLREMAKLQTVFILQLLFGTFRLCVLQRTSAGLRSVHPGGNITLHCDITVEYDIWWYHQSSEEMKQLITAIKGKLSKSFTLNYNLNEDHYDGIINPGSVDLVIVGVNETDLGLYYCGGRNDTQHIQFGKAIRLNFTGGDLQSNSSSAHTDSECPSPDPAPCQITIIVLASVCLISVLMNFIFSWVFCYRAQGKDHTDGNAEDSIEKDGDLHYASLQHTAVTRRAAKGNRAPEPDLDSVTYSGITTRPTGH